jgi:hypothetical protein
MAVSLLSDDPWKLVTFITGGVSMVIFFFVFKIIFPEGEAKKATV